MAAPHRYWRVKDISITPGSSFLEISEWHLYYGPTRVDASATISASHTIYSGLITYLQDNNTSTRPYWAESDLSDPTFCIKWDFGAGNEQRVDGSKFAGFDTSGRAPKSFTLQYSDDGSTWTTHRSVNGLSYPGNYTFTSLIPLAPPTKIAGVVKDASGAPIEGRVVRVYRRDNGTLLASDTSAATTGAFSIVLTYEDECTVVVLGADAGSENALIFDRVIPVPV